MMLFADIINIDIKTAALGVFRTIVFTLDELIYKFIIILYNIFDALCHAELMDNDLILEFAKRIGLILGLVMFFYVVFDFIQIMLDPDKMADKEKGPVNIIKKCVIVLVLLGASSFIFDTMTKFQNAVLDGDLIGKLILPYDVDADNFGNSLSANLMGTFYRLDTSSSAQSGKKFDTFDYATCETMVNAFHNQIVTSGEFSLGYNCLNERYTYDVYNVNGNEQEVTDFYVKFNLLSIVVGIFIAWMLITYCISVGMRVIQLTILQIISPVAFVSYLSPKKDTMLSKWFKIYFATYIDVFIRIGIINIVVYLCAIILDNWGTANGIFWQSVGSPTGDVAFWIGVFMILALLSFAKKAPDLIKELLPASASKLGFGIGLKDHAGLGFLGGALAGGVTGIIGGAAAGKSVGSRIWGGLKGGVTGIGRGVASGAKAKDLRGSITDASKGQSKANLTRAQRISAGMTNRDIISEGFRNMFGMEAASASDTRDINTLTAYANLESTIEGYADNNKTIKRLKRDYEAIQQGGKQAHETDAEFSHRLERARKKWTAAKEDYISKAMRGEFTENGRHSASFTVDGTTYKTYYDVEVVDNAGKAGADVLSISSIVSGKQEMERMHGEHPSVFGGNYQGINSYDDMDKNVNQARHDVAKRNASRTRTSGK